MTETTAAADFVPQAWEQAADALDAMAARLRAGWTQGVFARDAEGEPCEYFDGGAASFCMAGARLASMPAQATRDYDEWRSIRILAEVAVLKAIANGTGGALGEDVYNDQPSRTQADCVATAESAAAWCREMRPGLMQPDAFTSDWRVVVHGPDGNTSIRLVHRLGELRMSE